MAAPKKPSLLFRRSPDALFAAGLLIVGAGIVAGIVVNLYFGGVMFTVGAALLVIGAFMSRAKGPTELGGPRVKGKADLENPDATAAEVERAKEELGGD